jgi:hypothetical protein
MNWSYWSSIHFFGRAQVGPKKISIDETGELWTKVWGLWTFGVRCDPAEVLARDNPIFGIVSFHPLAYVVFFSWITVHGCSPTFCWQVTSPQGPTVGHAMLQSFPSAMTGGIWHEPLLCGHCQCARRRRTEAISGFALGAKPWAVDKPRWISRRTTWIHWEWKRWIQDWSLVMKSRFNILQWVSVPCQRYKA